MIAPAEENSGCTLLESVRGYTPSSELEAAHREQIVRFVATRPFPFDRAYLDAHVTASALIVDAPGRRVLLGYHRKLQRWLQLGGHGEPGEESAEAVALRESLEESGVAGLRFHPSAPRPFDLDVHTIPARGTVPEHLHLDVRYLLVAPPGTEPVLSDEEHMAMRWFTWEEAAGLELDDSLRRMISKARALDV